MKSFNKKVVWITGASAGIGEALALAFASEGASLVLSARNIGVLEAVAGKCLDAGASSVLVEPLDLTKSESFNERAASVVARTGRIDVLVNNGGRSQRSLVKDTPVEIYRDLLEVNFFGALVLTKAVLPFMIKQQSGQIIIISSLVGKIGSPLRSGYAAGKHALHGFFDSLRAELINDHIGVLMVCPGFIKTNISVNATDASGKPTGTMDENQQNGMEPSLVAKKIIAAAKAGKQEIAVGGKETLVLYIKRWFPGMVNRIVSRKH